LIQHFVSSSNTNCLLSWKTQRNFLVFLIITIYPKMILQKIINQCDACFSWSYFLITFHVILNICYCSTIWINKYKEKRNFLKISVILLKILSSKTEVRLGYYFFSVESTKCRLQNLMSSNSVKKKSCVCTLSNPKICWAKYLGCNNFCKTE